MKHRKLPPSPRLRKDRHSRFCVLCQRRAGESHFAAGADHCLACAALPPFVQRRNRLLRELHLLVVASGRRLRERLKWLTQCCADEDQAVAAAATELLSLTAVSVKGQLGWARTERVEELRTSARKLVASGHPTPWVQAACAEEWGEQTLALNELHLPCDERDWVLIAGYFDSE